MPVVTARLSNVPMTVMPMLTSRAEVQQAGVRNVAMDECVVGMAFDVAQIRQVASVGEVIEVHDPPAGAVPQQQPDKVAADESAAAGDQHDGCHLRLKIIVRIPQVRQVGIPR